MKMIAATVLSITLVIVATPSLAAKETCNFAAGWCVKKGGDRASCFEAQRMASCKASGTYMAPSGRAWPAPGK
jgi:hypothetical protein